MVKNIEYFRPELQFESFREIKVLQQTRIQVPEVWSLNVIAAATIATRLRNAEKRCCSNHIAAIKIWIGWVSNKIAYLIHDWPGNPIHEMEIPSVQRSPHIGEADMRSVGGKGPAG